MKNNKDNRQPVEPTTLSERLAYALKMLRVSQADLARKIGIKPQAIQYLCNSNAKKSGFTYEIAEALGISSAWLANGEGSIQLDDTPEIKLMKSQKGIPIIQWCDIEKWVNQNFDSTMDQKNEWILINSEGSNNCFAVRLQDKSMYPRFEQNTILIIDPERIPQNKDFVISRLNKTGEFIFRQYEVLDSDIRLSPMNTEIYKTIILKNNDVICGVMVEARWQL